MVRESGDASRLRYFKREAHKFGVDANERDAEKALVRKRDDTLNLNPVGAVCLEAIVRNRNLEFAAGLRVFVQKGQAIEQACARELDHEIRFAFLKNATDGV